jgi:GTP-binding protein
VFDRATIHVRGGKGGNGSVSFRREKHVPRGGPDGGDGGRGGDVWLVASRQVRDLSSFRQKVHIRAQNGEPGAGAHKRGADGDDVLVEVPVGTEVRDKKSGQVIADLVQEGERVLVARGGEGGRGNVCFVSSRRRAPRFAERGLPGEERSLLLNLKLLADVGLVGLPNAGKSSLLAALTRAQPKVAPYPFTTLEPNLGTLMIDERQIVLADIPGLIEGASAGAGLGQRFLAHIERTAVLLYVVDASAGASGVREALGTVRSELAAFNAKLLERPALCVLNKRDLVDDEALTRAFAAVASDSAQWAWATPPVVVSALRGDGMAALVQALGRALAAVEPPPAPAPAPAPALRPGEQRVGAFIVSQVEEDRWVVHGAALERLVAKADLGNDEAVRYLQEVMERAGVSAALRRAGARPGATVLIGENEFLFEEGSL